MQPYITPHLNTVDTFASFTTIMTVLCGMFFLDNGGKND